MVPLCWTVTCGLFPQTVEEEALIKNNNTCKDFLIEAMKYHLLPMDQRLLIKNPRTKPRTPVSLPKVNPSSVSAEVRTVHSALVLGHGSICDLRDGSLGSSGIC